MATPIDDAKADMERRVRELNDARQHYQAEGLIFSFNDDPPGAGLTMQAPVYRLTSS